MKYLLCNKIFYSILVKKIKIKNYLKMCFKVVTMRGHCYILSSTLKKTSFISIIFEV